MSYPNVDRQSDTLINSISKQILIMVNKVKNLLGTNDCSLAKLRHEATNYDKLTKPEMLVEYKSQLTDYFSFGEEYVHTCIKTLINEKLGNHVIKLKATLEDRLNDELVLVQYQSYEDAKVQADLSLMRAEISSLDSLLKEIKAENVALALRVAELETLTNELLAGSAEDKSKIKSLEMSHKELELSNAKLSSDVSELWKFAEYSKGDILEHKGVINTQKVQISDLNNIVGVQQVQIGEQQVQIEVLTTDVKEKTVQIKALEHKVGEQHIVICEQQQELTEVKVELTEVKTQVSTILENQAKAAAMYEKLLSFEEDLVSMEEGAVITKELIDSLVSKAHALIGDTYSVINNLNYHKASFEERSQWKKMVDNLRGYLQRMSKFSLNPNAQLQMIDKIEKDYYVGYGNAT